MLFFVLRLKKGSLRTRGFHIEGTGQRTEGGPQHPLTSLVNLSNQRDDSATMANRRPNFDLHSNDNTLSLGSKFPRANGGNIKDKISLWEGKEATHSPISSGLSGQCAGVKKPESLTKSCSKTTDEPSGESCSRVHREKENLGKENTGKPLDSRPCSPVGGGKPKRGTLRSSKPGENRRDKERQNSEKENMEEVEDSRPCSPVGSGKPLRGTLKSNKPSEAQKEEGGRRETNKGKTGHENANVEKPGETRPCSPVAAVVASRKSNEQTQSTQEKRDVFTLFKKLEAMGKNHGKTPPELGNYFSPPSKEKPAEGTKKETDAVSLRNPLRSVGVADGNEHQENVYTEPGSPPINPVPKPRRTFQHEKSEREGRARRNLPPLPSNSMRPSSKPPSGVHGRIRDDINRYKQTRSVSHNNQTLTDIRNVKLNSHTVLLTVQGIL